VICVVAGSGGGGGGGGGGSRKRAFPFGRPFAQVDHTTGEKKSGYALSDSD